MRGGDERAFGVSGGGSEVSRGSGELEEGSFGVQDLYRSFLSPFDCFVRVFASSRESELLCSQP